MLNNYKEYKNIKMPEDMKMNILENMQEAKPKKNLALKRRIIIYAAVFVCLTMLVSAAVIIPKYNYVVISMSEGMEIEELYITPQVLELNEKTRVDSAYRIKYSFDDDYYYETRSDLWITLTNVTDPDIKIITEEYGEIEVTFSVPLFNFWFNPKDYQYYVLAFPEVNEFTIINNGDSIDVKLEAYSGERKPGGKYKIKAEAFTISDHNK